MRMRLVNSRAIAADVKAWAMERERDAARTDLQVGMVLGYTKRRSPNPNNPRHKDFDLDNVGKTARAGYELIENGYIGVSSLRDIEMQQAREILEPCYARLKRIISGELSNTDSAKIHLQNMLLLALNKPIDKGWRARLREAFDGFDAAA